MEISLTKTQKDIAKEARRFLKNECPLDYVFEMVDDPHGFTKDLWDKMTEMDWMAMRIPEAYGGMEMEQIDINLAAGKIFSSESNFLFTTKATICSSCIEQNFCHMAMMLSICSLVKHLPLPFYSEIFQPIKNVTDHFLI